jgi:hypothetical protein
MRRHYPAYFRSLAHFKPYRIRLVTSEDLGEILGLLDEIAGIQPGSLPPDPAPEAAHHIRAGRSVRHKLRLAAA